MHERGGRGLSRVATCLLAVAGALLASGGRAEAFGVPVWDWRAYAVANPAQGWAWQVQRSQLPSLGAVSGIPSGDLAVAWLGQPDKLAYLGIGGADAQSLRGATLELAIDVDGPNQGLDAAELRGCVIVSRWEPAEPMAWDRRPLTVCEDGALGAYDQRAEAFRFPLAPLAEALHSRGVHGISIEPAESSASPFQVVFKGVADGGVRLTSTGTQGSVPRNASSQPEVSPAEPGSGSRAFPSASAPAARSSSNEELLTATQRSTPQPALPRGRPFGLGGVYGALAALAVLPLAGRVISSFTKKEDER